MRLFSKKLLIVIKYFQFILLSLLSTLSYSQTNNAYKFKIDLVNVSDDKVRVELTTPVIKSNTITYHVPKIVPGTYSEDDFGRYIEQFRALDKNGKELSVTQNDVNNWSIADAGKLSKISYVVNDTYDSLNAKPAIFEPAGSNIQKDTDYVINNHCFLGYFDDMKNVQYEITIQHPANMYGSTALTDMDNSNTAESAAAYALCYKCHNRTSILGNQSFSRHQLHIGSVQASCALCHDSHGISSTQGNATNNAHLVNFDKRFVTPSSGGILRYDSLGTRTGRCYLTCHGRNHNPETY